MLQIDKIYYIAIKKISDKMIFSKKHDYKLLI